MRCPAPVFPASSGDVCAGRRRDPLAALETFVLLLLSWIPGFRCRYRERLFRLEFCEWGNSDKTVDLLFDPNDWLKQHPEIAAQVIWLNPDATLAPWGAWTRAQRSDLRKAYWRCRLQIGNEIPDAPMEAAPDGLNAGAGTYYPTNLAWRIFVANVAQTIACEQAGWVPWSVLTLPAPDRVPFFDARCFFEITRSGGGRYFPHYGAARSFFVETGATESCTQSDPTRVFKAVRQRDLVGSSRTETILRVMDWCRGLTHYSDGPNPANCRNHWGYSGFAPVIRVIEGTTRADDGEAARFTMGCRGTVAVMRSMLRSLNVPVHIWNLGHQLAEFPTEARFISHGDDFYSRFVDPAATPIAEYWFGQDHFDAWFVNAGPNRATNIGRRAGELCVLRPSSALILRTHCGDLAAGRAHDSTHEDSAYSLFKGWYTPQALEATGFWTRLDAALAARGGCNAIP